MAKNPFLQRDDPDVTDPGDDGTKGGEGGEEENELFGTDPAGDVGDDDEEVVEDGDEDSALFDADPDPEETQIPKGWTKGTYNRFTQVIGQRNDGRTQIAEQAATIKSLQTAIDSHKGIVGVIAEKYGKFENPAAMVAADAAFMDAVEELGKTNPEVARFGAAIQNFLRTGEVPKMADGTQPAAPAPAVTPEPEKPAEDPRITKIIEGNARKSVKETLAGLDVKPSFRDIIADHVVKQDGLDLTNLSEPQVVEIAKQFIKDKGFTPADVLSKVVDGKGGKKVKTGGKAGVRTKDAGPGEAGKGGPQRPKAPKDLDEWNASREERRAAFVRESTSD